MTDRLLYILGVVFWRLVFLFVCIVLLPFGLAGVAFIWAVETAERFGVKRRKDLTSGDYYGR